MGNGGKYKMMENGRMDDGLQKQRSWWLSILLVNQEDGLQKQKA
jgi:hypothetical protein